MRKIMRIATALLTAFAILLVGTVNIYAEETPTVERTISEVSIKEDTISTYRYGDAITVESIWLQVKYAEGDVAEVHPDSIEGLDLTRTGSQHLVLVYGTYRLDYDITIMPRQVTNLVRAGSTADSMTIQWDALSEATQYVVYISDRDDGEFTQLDTTTETKYTISNLTGIKYVKVHAVGNEELAGDDSVVIPIAPKPAKVTGLKYLKGYKTRIQVQWDDVEGATGYRVYYRKTTDEGNTYRIAKDVTETNTIVEGLTAGYNYEIKISAYTIDAENRSVACTPVLTGTAPSSPAIPIYAGGDGRLKFTWKGVTGAEYYDVYLSTGTNSNFAKLFSRKAAERKNYLLTGLENKQKYYIKVVARRKVADKTLQSASKIKDVYTDKPAATSSAAKLYKTQKELKQSAAYKTYKDFAKSLSYGRSYVIPGLRNTNVAGFAANRMVPQSLCFAGKYMLISAYDYTKVNNSVIYIVDKSTRRYVNTIVLPHMGHVGGIAYDGKNVWIAYGTKMQVLKYSTITKAAKSKEEYTELDKPDATCTTANQVSYMMYYKGMIWAGSYSQYAKQYMYGYTISNKSGKPSIRKVAQMLLPDRVQGVTGTSDGYLLISQSCQTKEGKSGFISKMLAYKPNWKKCRGNISIGKIKKKTTMPPMNEGLVISGAYTYIIYESNAFSECKAPLDRVTACKTANFLPAKKKKK